MTSSLIRGRPRRTRAQISVRVAHALVGGLVGVVWLVLPGMTAGGAVAGGADRPVAGAPGRQEGERTSTADLVMPVIAVASAGVLAGYGFWRRRRRAGGRTTPGGAPVAAAEPAVGELDERARAALVDADDWVRVSAEELGFAAARFAAAGAERTEVFARVLREAEAELAVAFRMRRQYEQGVPEEAAARRHALAGVVGRCEETGRLLDAQAAGFDQLRGLEEGPGGGLGAALTVAESRFRELTGRTGAAEARLRELGERYAPSSVLGVTGHVEQAKDRLVFATTRLNLARQCADRGEVERAAGGLRAAEGGVAQAAVLVGGVERLAGELTTAAAMVGAALTGGEVELAGARRPVTGVAGPYADIAPGELRARVGHADAVLAGVREEVASGRPYDPLELLRRIVGAVAPVAAGRAGVIAAAALVCARGSVAAADDVVATHRAAVGGAARTLLAEARRLLGSAEHGPGGRPDLAGLVTSDTLARQARELAEQDVRLYGNPLADGRDLTGRTGAALGGILLSTAAAQDTPAAFGGPRTRARRAVPPDG